MLPKISFTAGLVTFFTLSIASPGQGQGVTVCSRGDSYLISLKDLLLRVLAVEVEAGLCHILSSCLHVWAGGGGGGEGEHGTGYTSLISSQSSSMDGKLGK